jgi:replicative DNA helicase
MMEIRAKARRLKQRHNLSLVIVDYLQLMSSGKKVESRQQEVSEFSRSLKLLAKELEVPVVALSQLNRGPEQRTDKKPLISDLRESGCLTAATRVMRADTNAEVTLGELLAADARDIPVWSLDDRLKLVPRTMTHVFPSGTKEVFRLRLTSGREIEATANHPFLTYDGWKPLGDLVPGSRIGSLRHVPPPLDVTPWDDDDVCLLADLLVASEADVDTFVPPPVFRLPKEQVGEFVRRLWARGRVHWDERNGEAEISFSAAGRRLVDDVARLLLRFNVFTRIETVREGGGIRYRLHIHGAENQLRFCEEIGVYGNLAGAVPEVQAALQPVCAGADLNTVPAEVWNRVRETLVGHQLTPRQVAPTAVALGVRRERLAEVAGILDDADLDVLATNDVYWDSVQSIESLGEQPVYDATVLGTHNFVAEGIPVHNSLEQDADIVILLHREDMHDRESPRAGEADLIVAKHRNGPCATVTVAFQGHYSRFVDMAPG